MAIDPLAKAPKNSKIDVLDMGHRGRTAEEIPDALYRAAIDSLNTQQPVEYANLNYEDVKRVRNFLTRISKENDQVGFAVRYVDHTMEITSGSLPSPKDDETVVTHKFTVAFMAQAKRKYTPRKKDETVEFEELTDDTEVA